jgi:hypothetical protein
MADWAYLLYVVPDQGGPYMSTLKFVGLATIGTLLVVNVIYVTINAIVAAITKNLTGSSKDTTNYFTWATFILSPILSFFAAKYTLWLIG